MTASTTDRIEKQVTLRADRSRVWRALTDFEEFGQWFRVRLEGPFRVGEGVRGQITYEGYEHMVLEAWVERMDAEELFAFRWHPHALDPDKDYTGDPTTLVEFRLEDAEGGTRLTITESGFDALPEELRSECFLRNVEGWTIQVENIRTHVDG